MARRRKRFGSDSKPAGFCRLPSASGAPAPDGFTLCTASGCADLNRGAWGRSHGESDHRSVNCCGRRRGQLPALAVHFRVSRMHLQSEGTQGGRLREFSELWRDVGELQCAAGVSVPAWRVYQIGSEPEEHACLQR